MGADDTPRVRSPIGDMQLFDDGVIVHTIDEGALVDENVAAGVLETTRVLAAGQPVSVVVDLRGGAEGVGVPRRDVHAREAGAADVDLRQP